MWQLVVYSSLSNYTSHVQQNIIILDEHVIGHSFVNEHEKPFKMLRSKKK